MVFVILNIEFGRTKRKSAPLKKIISGYLKNHDLAEIGFKKFQSGFADMDPSGHGRGQVQVGSIKYFESKYNDDELWFSYRSEYNLLENLSEHMLVFLSLKNMLAFYP